MFIFFLTSFPASLFIWTRTFIWTPRVQRCLMPLWDVYLDIKVYWILLASLWNSTFVTALLNPFEMVSVYFVLFLIVSGIPWVRLWWKLHLLFAIVYLDGHVQPYLSSDNPFWIVLRYSEALLRPLQNALWT